MSQSAQALKTPAIAQFCTKWLINELSIFGSAVRDELRPDSDIDFIADFDPSAEWSLFDHMEMEDELSAIVQRPVDLLTRYSVESDPNRFYRQRILSHTESVYAR